MLDSTSRKRSVPVAAEDRRIAPDTWREGIGFKIFLAKVRQRKRTLLRLMLLGVAMGWLAGIAYSFVKIPTYTASSELLISNTTLQLSGPDAVVTQILVENSLIQSAIEMLKSGSVLGRVIDKVGLENIERILPRSFAERLADRIGSKKLERVLPTSQKTHDVVPLGTQVFENERTEVSRQAALSRLRSNTTVDRVGASQIISVRGRALTAEDAAKLTNEMAQAFVQEQSETNAVVTTSAALRERIKVLGPTARIISEAVPPTSWDGLPVGGIPVLALVLGGSLGVVIGLVLTLFDRRVRSAEQLVAVTSADFLGYVPRVKPRRGMGARQSIRFGLGSISGGAVLRRVGSAVLERSGGGPHFVGVTSCHWAEGKTTLAASLARSVARDGSPVLLVDASGDAAGPLSKQGKVQGLQELLRGEVAPSDVIQPEIDANLDFLPSGNALGNLDALWGNLAPAINAGGDCFYGWVILDLPALTTDVDVRAACQVVDDLLIVVEWGRTSEARLEQALRALGPMRDKIVGTVINKTPRFRSMPTC